MSKKVIVGLMIVAVLVSVSLFGCAAQPKVGTLQFNANGEDFVRQGFISKDDWSVTFDHVYVTLAEITGYQSDPSYDPHQGSEVKAEVKANLEGTHTVDLAEGGEDAPPILVGEVQYAPAGQYNAISWKMIPASSGLALGYPLFIVGTAQKDDQTINFTIRVEQEYEYTCGEYVGDQRKGILQENGTADLEMTFHFDHIFGDAETPMDDDLNIGAPGFEPFAAVAEGGSLDIDIAGMQAASSPEDYKALADILPTLGHVGEGHCHCEAK